MKKSKVRYALGFAVCALILLLQAIPKTSVVIVESGTIWSVLLAVTALLCAGYLWGFWASGKPFFTSVSRGYKIIWNLLGFVPLILVVIRGTVTGLDIAGKFKMGVPDVLSNAGAVLSISFYILLVLAIALPMAGHLRLVEPETDPETLYYEKNVNGTSVRCRKKMSNRDFRKILAPILSVILVLSLVVTALADYFAIYLDNNIGRGERYVVNTGEGEKLDLNFYGERPTPEEAKAKALETVNKVTDEGMILLKNDGILPLKPDTTVTPFGKAYVFPFYDSPGDMSSMKHSFDFAVTPKEALEAKFNVLPYAADLQPKTTTKAGSTSNGNSNFDMYPDQPEAAPGTKNLEENSFGANGRIPELAVSRYDEITSSQLDEMKESVGLVFICRTSAEGMDQKFDGYSDGTPHYFALSKNEKDMIKKAKETCQKVVVLINSSNPVELLPVMEGECEADAILWVGNPGEEGFHSMARILCGEVTPSGRTYDILAADFLKGPEMANFGNFIYSNVPAGGSTEENPTYETYVEYAEGMYYGYRFYETAHDIGAEGFTYGELTEDGGIKEKGAVCYPFGYGLSYTTFDQSIVGYDDSKDEITVKVKVENTGDCEGKEVVQIYYNPPYTSYDKENGIEKPTATLCAFGKTELLQPGQSEELELSFSKEELASYNAARDNKDGTTGCYMLEEGTYEISLRANSHVILDTREFVQEETVFYDNTNPRQYEIEKQAYMDEEGNLLDYPEKQAVDEDAKFIAATNIFPYMTEYMQEETVALTRANWEETLPVNTRKSSTDVPSKELGEKYVQMIRDGENYDLATNKQLGTIEGSKVYTDKMPASGKDNGLSLEDMRGKDFYDEDWDKLLDQIDWDNEKDVIKEFIVSSNYYTPAIESIGMMKIKHTEGANGIRVGPTRSQQHTTVTWCMCPVMAATWNVELAREIGEAMAYEAFANDVSARYSPAFNIHRSPFSGRIMEYYSEDPFLTGTFVTAMLNGSTNGGLIEYMKHFCLNDQETNRTGVNTWASEQVVREIYSKPFEMCMRNARKTIKYIGEDKNVKTKVMRGATGMMMSMNAVGPTVSWVNYDLVTRFVRNELNFNGVINTDWTYGWPGYIDMTIFAGTDSWLTGGWDTSSLYSLADMDSATARTAYRNAIHHIAYQIANSNAMQDVGPGAVIKYELSPWMNWLIIFDSVAGAVILLGIIWMVLRTKSQKKYPERYREK